MSRWCLVYYTGEPYTARKTQSQTDIRQNEPSDSDKEQPISTSNIETTRRKISLMMDMMRVLKQWKRKMLVPLRKEILTEKVKN